MSNQDRPRPQATGTAARSARNGTATPTTTATMAQVGGGASSIGLPRPAGSVRVELFKRTTLRPFNRSHVGANDRRGPERQIVGWRHWRRANLNDTAPSDRVPRPSCRRPRYTAGTSMMTSVEPETSEHRFGTGETERTTSPLELLDDRLRQHGLVE